MNVQLHLGDCLSVLAGLPENSIDTCITDPPYELGFMGKKWDSSGIAFQPETWQAVYRVLKPGAILLAFGGTRTYHRLVCAIEDAGFEIRDTIAWVYGSGFPKSYDISKGIDKKAGAKREVVGWNENLTGRTRPEGNPVRFTNKANGTLTAPSTPEAQLWDGWGTALKPAFEPIVVAMKPLDGTYVENALKWGVAGLWIDGGRIGNEEINLHGNNGNVFGGGESEKNYHTIIGRFPANLIHDGSDEVLEVFPQTTSGNLNSGHKRGDGTGNSFMGGGGVVQGNYGGDSGSAARFFYCAKASRAERNAGLEGMEAQRKAGAEFRPNHMEKAMNGEDGNPYGRWGMTQNNHPTVKPIELMRYLVRLTKTPTGGVVLDPFMGSGTTGIACVLEGREFIGIEREPEYVEIAEKRIAHYRLPIMDEVGA